MTNKCPGRSTNKPLDSIVLKCKCGKDIELFSDEPKVRCNCGNVVLNDVAPNCSKWCQFADKCLNSK